MLSCVERATLVTLVRLRKLLLRRHVEIALSYGKLFHVSLRIHILNALINIVYRSSVLLILRCRQILKFSECVFLIYYSIAYKILTGSGRTCLIRLILIYTLLLTLLKRLLILIFKDTIRLCTLKVIDMFARTLNF